MGIGTVLYWEAVSETFGGVVQYGACIGCGAALGFRRAFDENVVLLSDGVSLSWRVSVGWIALTATVEQVLTGDSLLSVSTFAWKGIQWAFAFYVPYVAVHLARERRIFRRRRSLPERSRGGIWPNIWAAIAAIAAVGAFAMNVIQSGLFGP